MSLRLVADVGGTNVRFALVDEAQGQLLHTDRMHCRAFPEFSDAVAHYLEKLDSPTPSKACLAVAAPPAGDRVQMLNMDWTFSKQAIQEQFNFAQLRVVNDFEAIALSLPHLQASQLQLIAAGCSGNRGNLAALGPGTGLGGSIFLQDGEELRAIACEPGSTELAPTSEEEYEVFQYLRQQHGRVYKEMLLSGPGLEILYGALAGLRKLPREPLDAAAITATALARPQSLCREVLARFCALLGTAAGDFVLSTGSYGGLYLAGGILPRFIPFLRESDFMQRFTNKGAMAETLSRVPVYVITEAQPGLIGAAHARLG